MPDTWGRECKLGWGWNKSLDRLIPVQGEPPDVTPKAWSAWACWASPLSLTDVPSWGYITLLLEPSYRKILDFGIVLDDKEYWQVLCRFWRRAEEFEKPPKHPIDCSHYVNGIWYGADLWIQFPKIGFPETGVETLFRERNFNEIQKNTKCRVLINYNETREISLEELIQFIKELDEGKNSQYDIPVVFLHAELAQEHRETAITNVYTFRDFLSYLYCVYRKIEIKMEKAGYPDILPDLDSEEKSFDNILANLYIAKEKYKTIDKSDFSKMYPVLKKLFFAYTDYIGYSMDNKIDIYEGNSLPGSVNEMKYWLQKLNTWVPIQINKNISCTKYRVWIKCDEVKDLTFREFLDMKKRIEDGKCPDLDIPSSFYYQKLIGQLRGMEVSNDNEFTDFISHLYFVYRKIEMKMKTTEYRNILKKPKSDKRSFADISVRLTEAKKLFKSMDRNNFLKMYPVIKKLFFCYIDYIKCATGLRSDIDEGKYLPGTVGELKSWSLQLDNWFPIKINKKWKSCTGQFIGTPKGLDQVIRKFQETVRFREVLIFGDEEVIEPYIGEEGNKRIIFGLIDMEGAKESEIPTDLELFESECPEKCTEDLRKWICTKCGDFVSQKDMVLYCSCGSKRYKDKLLTCPHPSHR